MINQDGETIEQINHYYPFGDSFGDELDWYDFGARPYDRSSGCFPSTMDPLCEKYYSISPYAYCLNNPVNCIDPDGRSTWVIANPDSTYRVIGGNLNDNDLNIYVCSIQDNKFVIGSSIGESDLISSFYDSDTKSWAIGSTIDPNDKSGMDFLSSFDNEEPAITDYMANGVGFGKYDFKRQGMTKNSIDDLKYYYRGMPIRTENGKTIYSSARDIGNYAAGYIAGYHQISWELARSQFDKLQSEQDHHPSIEGFSSQNAQFRG